MRGRRRDETRRDETRRDETRRETKWGWIEKKLEDAIVGKEKGKKEKEKENGDVWHLNLTVTDQTFQRNWYQLSINWLYERIHISINISSSFSYFFYDAVE